MKQRRHRVFAPELFSQCIRVAELPFPTFSLILIIFFQILHFITNMCIEYLL